MVRWKKKESAENKHMSCLHSKHMLLSEVTGVTVCANGKQWWDRWLCRRDICVLCVAAKPNVQL